MIIHIQKGEMFRREDKKTYGKIPKKKELSLAHTPKTLNLFFKPKTTCNSYHNK